MIDHLFEGLEAAVMHVGRSTCRFSQAGSLESAALLIASGHRHAPGIHGPADAGVVEPLIGKIGAHMTHGAAGLTAEDAETGALLGGHRTAVALQIPVVGRVAR